MFGRLFAEKKEAHKYFATCTLLSLYLLFTLYFLSLCAVQTFASEQCLAIVVHGWHIVCNDALYQIHNLCFHNCYPFFFFVLILRAQLCVRFYLPISILLFTWIACATIAPTTNKIITVIIVFSFLFRRLPLSLGLTLSFKTILPFRVQR